MAPSTKTATGSSNPKSENIPVKAVTHDSTQTIRAQSKKDKIKDKTGQDGGDRAGMSKEVVKAVLASPLTTTWPNIPKHFQTATLHALKELIPSEIADYHVSRARCHQREKRINRKIMRKDKNKKDQEVSDKDGEDEVMKGVNGALKEGDQAVRSKRNSSGPTSNEPATKKPRLDLSEAQDGSSTHKPTKPEILSHMVLGINEVLKSLESQIAELKIRLMIMSDALDGKITPTALAHRGKQKTNYQSHLLPTAPRSPSSSPEPELADQHGADEEQKPVSSSLEFIVVPLLSINPPSLVSSIPQYCATYNTLVYQHSQLTKICRTRLKATELDEVVGSEREEARVVPLGAVEKEIAELVGLRRVACLGIRHSHPSISILQKLLPKSVLHPPRHSITLPIPTSSLSIHDGNITHPVKETKTAKTPMAGVHYADLHIKGIRTKMPVDNTARKAKRMEEVRRKRVEAKLKKREMNGQRKTGEKEQKK
ncbi:hypothetical protein I302_103544 [Kwoniella bestiolae CBS 10118]|uniref:Uncharacterized protein n=1 Tax=Kwoniella bestiolae CBS 10118 TaxID=1296100 RepID=A0A1B9G8R6_9TREE|nr:hypothetical protein I302_02245 [Kwoniella bestiolae CBS 10118]OCF27403.1 hypothetical protein I302_02245 [Kwoniella bestiolae CBS 10118]